MKFSPSYASICYTAAIAGTFSMIVCGVMVIGFLSRPTQLALDDPRYQDLKLAIEQDATDDASRDQLRQLDAQLRGRYFRQQTFLRRGAYLLSGGVAATLLFSHWATTVRRRLPRPKAAFASEDVEARINQLAQWATGGVVIALLTIVVVSRAASTSVLPDSRHELGLSQSRLSHRESSGTVAERTATMQQPLPEADDSESLSQAKGGESDPTRLSPGQVATTTVRSTVSQEQFSLSWPRFRGIHGSGVSAFQDVPTTWNGATGAGVLWKTSIPLPGVSSPIVWQDRVFLTGATQDRRELYCLDAAAGNVLWRKTVGAELPNKAELKVSEETGLAAPTPATDGQRVYAMFARGDLAAFDFDGNELWYLNLGPPQNPYGHASSLTTYKDLLIVQLDQGTGRDGKSKLLALRGATGEVAWETKRTVPASWSTPIVVEQAGQAQIITCSQPWVIAYAAVDGSEIWRADCLAGDVGPSPVYDNGVVYVANDNAAVAAIDAAGRGDVTESHIRWLAEYALPDICSPLLTDRHLLLVTSYGTLAGYDREHGGDEPLWEEDVGIGTASPSRVGDHIYLINENGQGSVLRPSDSGCEKLAENELGERCFASPAFQPGRIYIRGEHHLFCIGQPQQE